MAQIRWSLSAADDLRAIEDYVARDSPTYAVRLVDRLVDAVVRLGPFPYSGRVVPEFGRESLREVIKGPYRIVYLVEGEVVTILRLVHAARDLERLYGFDAEDSERG